MKKLYLLTALVFITGLAKSQNLIETDRTWSVVECVGSCITNIYKFDGDTIINSTTYQKLWHTTDSTLTYWYYYGAFREEANGKVYQNGAQGDELLYDFGLVVNEEFNTEITGCEISEIVTLVDTVTLLNGEQRKRINFSYILEPWIEGIGSLTGLINVGSENCAFDVHYILNCFTDQGILKYKNSEFDGCYVITTGIQENTSGTWKLSPNPFTDNAEFTFPYHNNYHYELQIIDLYGRIIESIIDINSGEIMIQDQNLNSGIYLFRLMENDQLRFAGKMIKR
jgi:hypothetical protein